MPPPSGYPGYPHRNPGYPPPQPYPGYPGGYPGNAVDPQAPFGANPATGQPLSDKSATTAGLLQLFRGCSASVASTIRLDPDCDCAVFAGSVRARLHPVLPFRVSVPARQHRLGHRRCDPDVHRQRQRQPRPQVTLEGFARSRSGHKKIFPPHIMRNGASYRRDGPGKIKLHFVHRRTALKLPLIVAAGAALAGGLAPWRAGPVAGGPRQRLVPGARLARRRKLRHVDRRQPARDVQPGTYDARRIDAELAFARLIGFNTVRVFLHDLLWAQDRRDSQVGSANSSASRPATASSRCSSCSTPAGTRSPGRARNPRRPRECTTPGGCKARVPSASPTPATRRPARLRHRRVEPIPQR